MAQLNTEIDISHLLCEMGHFALAEEGPWFCPAGAPLAGGQQEKDTLFSYTVLLRLFSFHKRMSFMKKT